MTQSRQGSRDFRERLLNLKARARKLYTSYDQAGVDVTKLGKRWSAFAALCVELALQEAWKKTPIAARCLSLVPSNTKQNPEKHTSPKRQIATKSPEKEKTRSTTRDAASIPGLFILGLGKMGGGDLNYSSDIDLVAFFDTSKLPIPEHVGRTYVCSQVLRYMTRLLDTGVDNRFVWRVDWRLRPDPSVSDLSMSTEGAENFFFFCAAPWRRLAMIKAQVVAGDKKAGTAFLHNIHPFVWRRHLDYGTIDEIASLKNRIHRDHPELDEERRCLTPLTVAEGFHLKLGLGGIREIEFYVNARQLLLGGRIPGLQIANTLDALEVLIRENLIKEQEGRQLIQAYRFFRSLENRIQYAKDEQTHSLPKNPGDQAQLAKWSGFENWQALAEAVLKARKQVATIFSALFETKAEESDTCKQAPLCSQDMTGEKAQNLDTEKQSHQNHRIKDKAANQKTKVRSGIWTELELDEITEKIARSWIERPFNSYGVSDQGGRRLETVGWQMISLVHETSNHVSAVKTIDEFLHSLRQAGSYLRLYADQPLALIQVIRPLLNSPAIRILLFQSPHVVDGLLAHSGTFSIVPDIEQGRDMLKAAERLETRLEAARAWVNEQLYLCFLAVFEHRLNFVKAEHFLTDLAVAALDLIADLIAGDMELENLPFTILAMGRLGMQAMMPQSDLDLIFIVPDEDKNAQEEADNRQSYETAQLAARRFISALSARMREGQIYEIDTRLRPSGRSGPVVVTYQRFCTYQRERAQTWEHLALAAMRPIQGTAALMKDLTQVKDEIIRLNRDQLQLVNDTVKMLHRLRTQRIGQKLDDPFEPKLCPGGLMETEYLINFLSLYHRIELATLPDKQAQAALNKIDPDFENFIENRRFLRDWTFAHRLWGADWFKTSGRSFKKEKFADICKATQSLIERHILQACLLSDREIKDHEELPIQIENCEASKYKDQKIVYNQE